MPTSTSTAVKQLSDGNGANGGPGTAFGVSALDKIGFYTSSATGPVVQPSGAAEAALVRGIAGAVLAVQATSASPATGGTPISSSSEIAITMSIGAGTGTGMTFQPATGGGDVVFISKPTSQAGLAVGNVRVTATNQLAVTFSNYTAATITATTGEKWGATVIRGLPFISQALTPTTVPAASTIEQQFTVPGLRVGEVVQVNKPSAQATLNIVGCRVVAANTLGITYSNVSATTATTPVSETYTIFSTGGIDASANTILVEEYVGTLATAALSTSTALSLTMTGLQTTDAVVGVMKPTFQAGITSPTGFISAANALGVVFSNSTAANVTPTANEVYGVTIHRPNPAAPCVVYSATITPAAVAPNTAAEQTFTAFTSVVAGSMIWVNKPSITPGLGIGGVRVSGTGSICINYCNSTAATITPPSETYLLANFQQAVPDAGSSWVFTIYPQAYQNTILSNAIRAALGPTGTNLIAGA